MNATILITQSACTIGHIHMQQHPWAGCIPRTGDGGPQVLLHAVEGEHGTPKDDASDKLRITVDAVNTPVRWAQIEFSVRRAQVA